MKLVTDVTNMTDNDRLSIEPQSCARMCGYMGKSVTSVTRSLVSHTRMRVFR